MPTFHSKCYTYIGLGDRGKYRPYTPSVRVTTDMTRTCRPRPVGYKLRQHCLPHIYLVNVQAYTMPKHQTYVTLTRGDKVSLHCPVSIECRHGSALEAYDKRR